MIVDKEQLVIDLLCGKLQTSGSYCDSSCISCKFYHEESDMGARVSICIHGFGSSKKSCGCYMTQREYLEFMRSIFANLKAENAKLRELVRDMGHDIPKSESCEFDIHLGHCTPKIPCNGECAHWYRMKELGIEVK